MSATVNRAEEQPAKNVEHRCQMHMGDPSKPCGKPAPRSYTGTDGKTYYACRRHHRQWFSYNEPTLFERFVTGALYVVAIAVALLIVVAGVKWSYIEVFRR